MPLPCGIVDTQIFGEKLVNIEGVTTPCKCHGLCFEHQTCTSWKLFVEQNRCVLQETQFRGLGTGRICSIGSTENPCCVGKRFCFINMLKWFCVTQH